MSIRFVQINIDPENILEHSYKEQFKKLNQRYKSLFDPKIKHYNGKLGPINAAVSMGPAFPPQQNDRILQYSKNKLVEL